MGLEVTTTGNVCVATITREHRLNAIDDEVLKDLRELVRRADPEGIRAVVLTGAGTKAFSSGFDVKELARLAPHQRSAHTIVGNRLLNEIEECGCLFIAAVEGYCLGGGLELALACDLLIAGRDATFGLPEVGLNAVPSWTGPHRLSRVVGTARAKEVVLFGRRLTSDEAARWGLLSEVVETGGALGRAIEVASSAMANTDWATLATAKSLVHNSYGLTARAASYLSDLADMGQSASAERSASFSRFAGPPTDAGAT
jgi:enoyl-CoA hydratase